MSTIGKVLIVLNLILAAAFLASSVWLLDKQENWRLQYEAERAGRKADKDNLQKQIDDRDRDLTAQRSETNRVSQEAADLRGKTGQLEGQVTTLKDYQDKTVKEIQSLTTNFENFRRNNEELTKQLDEAKKSRDTAIEERTAAKKSQEDAENKMAQAEEASKQLQAQVNQLKEDNTGVSTKLTRAENALAVYAEKTGIPIDQVAVAPPLINGNVVAADMATRIIQLNVGSDAGVKRGFGFSIYRGPEFKGEAIVEDVAPKFSTARIIRTNSNRKIEVGDQATTRL